LNIINLTAQTSTDSHVSSVQYDINTVQLRRMSTVKYGVPDAMTETDGNG